MYTAYSHTAAVIELAKLKRMVNSLNTAGEITVA
jgi:hypothetical protein